MDVYFLTRIEITEDPVPSEKAKNCGERIESQESKSISEILFPLFVLVGIHFMIIVIVLSSSILLTIFSEDKNLFYEILEILPMIGFIEVVLGTLSQLSKTGCGGVGRKAQIWGGHIQMRELEELIDRQVQQIKKRKPPSRSRWKYTDLYMIVVGFILLLLSIMFLDKSMIQ